MIRVLTMVLLAGLWFVPARAGPENPIVGIASVIEADAIEISGQRIRLLDMDAPETQQLCQDTAGADYRCGQKAALLLSDFIGQRTVTCDGSDLDRYGRTLARCTVGGEDLGLWLIEQGWAVPYRYCKCETYRDAALEAAAQDRGIWAGVFQLPWEWRKANSPT
ncbi:MAG: thermonuclease family protein [Dongiaceae bacterium]